MLNILLYSLVALVIYAVLDLIWAALVAKNVYYNEVGEYVADTPNYFASIIAYILVAFGLVFFVTQPAIVDKDIVNAILQGLVFGFVVSGVYALTNLAVLKRWSITVALIDIAWVSFLSAGTSLLTYLIFA